MLRLRKNLQVLPPEVPGGKIRVTDPGSGKSFFLGPEEVNILRLIAKMPPSEVAQKMSLDPQKVHAFVEHFKVNNLFEGISAPVSQDLQNASVNLDVPAIEVRPDLFFTEDGESLLIEEPKTNRFFTLGINEAALLQDLMVSSINSVSEQSGYSIAELEAFIESLSQKGLLLRPLPQKEASPPAKTLLGLLVQRFKICDPDKFLGFIDEFFGWLWKGPLIGMHFAVLLFSVYLWFDQGQNFLAYGFPRLSTNFWINGAIFLAVVSFILAAHEFAHGLALKSFGGRVNEMGVFLLYGFPSAYTNVTGAYKLKEKSQKMWVVLAGVLFQAWIGSVAFILWNFVSSHSWLADLMYMFSFAAFFNLAINLNPLLKLDGYYLLTLWLNKPNLREKAGKFIFSGFRGVNSASEGVLFFVYGLSSFLYTALIFFWLFGGLYKLGLETAPFLSLLLLAVVLLAAKTPLPQSNSIELKNRHSVAKPSRHEQNFNWFPLLVMLLIAGMLFLKLPYQIGGEVEVAPLANARAIIHSPISGIIRKVFVKSGDYVKVGDILVEVVDWGLLEQLNQASGGAGAPRLQSLKSEIEQSRLQTQKLQVELAKAKLNLDNSLRKAKTYSALAKEGAFPQNTAQDAIFNAKAAEQDIRKLEKEIQLNRELERAAQSNMQTLNGQINFYKEKSALQRIKAPISGFILTEDTDLQIGASANPQESLLSVADLNKVQVKIKIVQEDLPNVGIGQKVTLTIRAYPGKKFEGQVSEIALLSEDLRKTDPTVVKDTGRRRWNVTMTFENPDLKLKPGMSGYAYIDSTQKRRLYEFVFNEIYRVFQLERFAVFRESLSQAKF